MAAVRRYLDYYYQPEGFGIFTMINHYMKSSILCVVLFSLAMVGVVRAQTPLPQAGLVEDFQGGVLVKDQWQITRQNDFSRSEIGVVRINENNFCLRLLADTMGTDDDTVKFHGVRMLQQIDFTEGKVLSFDLDWNNQLNGSYLTAGVYLAPVATDENPRVISDWIALEYVGVPPGENIRLQVARRRNGSLGFLFTEGWPEQQRVGRRVDGPRHLQLIIDAKGLAVIENGKDLFSTKEHGLSFTRGYLYLQMSSHSNYPAREIYFDNIHIGPMRVFATQSQF